MNILLLGSGGREHALAWKLADSALLSGVEDRLYAAPGNPGIADHAQLITLDVTDHRGVAVFCREKGIGLVVVGPEAPLVDGLADHLRAEGIAVFGPSRAAAQLEGSKGFTKDLCARAAIPTAGYIRTQTLDAALQALDDFSAPFVLKADGLAAGKGVVIAETRAEAEAALHDMFDGKFGAAGAEVVIEEFMTGEEVSLFVLSDGEAILPLGSAQDHKRVGEGDVGPNTGGMGAYSPAPVLTEALEREAMDNIIAPTVATLRAEGMPYSGVLFAGLMLTDQGPKLVEYNCRFGDPECQVLMMRLQEDLGELMLACAQGRLSEVSALKAGTGARFAPKSALSVVMAAHGYPGSAEKGGAIVLEGAETAGPTEDGSEHAGSKKGKSEEAGSEDSGSENSGPVGAGSNSTRVKIFHAGTKRREDGALEAAGGRVLNVTAMATGVRAAQQAAYKAVDSVDFDSGFCRRDIGWREVEREKNR